MHFVHLGKIMGEEGRNDQLEEYTGAGMEQPQQSCHGEAASWPLPRRLAEGILEGRRIGHRAPRAIDEEGAMPMPPPVVHGGSLSRATEALQKESKEMPWEFGALDSMPPR
jgi:hypothetical protein